MLYLEYQQNYKQFFKTSLFPVKEFLSVSKIFVPVSQDGQGAIELAGRQWLHLESRVGTSEQCHNYSAECLVKAKFSFI